MTPAKSKAYERHFWHGGYDKAITGDSNGNPEERNDRAEPQPSPEPATLA